MANGLNLRQALLAKGWTAIDTRTSLRAYADTSGHRFGTLEMDGVRIALSIGHSLVEERGAAVVYMSDESCDAILRALIVDVGLRKQGNAKRALAEIQKLANETFTTMYLEPVPIEDKPVEAPELASLYQQFGFEFSGPKNQVMVRHPICTSTASL